jgi:hypothetical protein
MECGYLESECECCTIPPYDVYPLKMKPLGEKDWHRNGYQRDFHNILRALVKEILNLELGSDINSHFQC